MHYYAYPVVFVAAFVAVAVPTADAIHCYVCSSPNDPTCGTLANQLKDCPTGSCVTANSTALKTVGRSCDAASHAAGCSEVAGAWTCYCTTDACNGSANSPAAAVSTPNRLLLVLVPVIAVARLVM